MMQPPAFLSIVVATRNRAGLLRDSVENLLAQDFPCERYEVIVVDDGSTDETSKVVPDINSRPHGRTLRYVRPERRGLTAARNAGLQVAIGDPIVFVDDDVFVPNTWLREVAEGCLRHPEAECLGGPVILRLEGEPPPLCDRDQLGDSHVDLGDPERQVDWACGANMVLRRAAVERIGGFNELLAAVGDEMEWESRLKEAGGLIIYLPKAGVVHRRTEKDLRLWSLLRARFQRGKQSVIYADVTGQQLSLSREFLAIPWFLAHAMRRRCAGGLLSASAAAGRIWGLLLGRRVSAPSSSSRSEAVGC